MIPASVIIPAHLTELYATQVLYFCPELRSGLLGSHMPEPDVEFCLSCEMAFLFRMMITGVGVPVQASAVPCHTSH
jgi:hypothetical protein